MKQKMGKSILDFLKSSKILEFKSVSKQQFIHKVVSLKTQSKYQRHHVENWSNISAFYYTGNLNFCAKTTIDECRLFRKNCLPKKFELLRQIDFRY